MHKYVWLSFCDDTKPKGKQFLGAALIEAPSFEAAIHLSWKLKLNPGGEVQGLGISEEEAEGMPYPIHKLMTREEIEHLEKSST